MAEHREFELRIVESPEGYPTSQLVRHGFTAADLVTTPQAALEALKATKGAQAVLEQVPLLERPDLWFDTAYFSVCRKSGTARWLDLWDVDHFDGFTDMQRSVSNCCAWFSDAGFDEFGSRQTATGVVNCFFEAPTADHYTCNARLQSWPADAQSFVECFIDDHSFGELPVLGTIDQPHHAVLGAGGHSFRIKQVSGAFFFLSLTVWAIPRSLP